MNPESSFSTALLSHSASIAAHASSPSLPPPNAPNAAPSAFSACASASARASSDPAASSSLSSSAARPGFPQYSRSDTVLTDGRPVSVLFFTGSGALVIPWSVNASAFLGAFPTDPPAFHASHSGLSALNSFVCSTLPFPSPVPAKSSCRICGRTGERAGTRGE